MCICDDLWDTHCGHAFRTLDTLSLLWFRIRRTMVHVYHCRLHSDIWLFCMTCRHLKVYSYRCYWNFSPYPLFYHQKLTSLITVLCYYYCYFCYFLSTWQANVSKELLLDFAPFSLTSHPIARPIAVKWDSILWELGSFLRQSHFVQLCSSKCRIWIDRRRSVAVYDGSWIVWARA